ncbi:MAG: DMT family transporter [Proteobacteria bacterium]|nr:DMT family transporter [Pseudomonadota bacterium]
MPYPKTVIPAAPRAQPLASPPSQQPLKGIGLMCLALAFFACLDTTAKYMGTMAQLPVAQVVWLRFVSQFVLMLMVAGILAVPKLLATQRIWHQLFRSSLMLGSTLLNFLALRTLRLDQAQTVYFLAPFTVALLSGPFLGEWVGWRRMTAILVGFSGILVVVRPGIAEFEPALILAFGSMLCYAAFMLLTRYLASFDAPMVTLFYSLLAGAFIMAPAALLQWVWPKDFVTWLLLVSMGFWGGLGHFIFIIAYRFAPASTLAPFIYLGLLTHSTAGWLVFNQVPDRWTLMGASIVIASGIYLLHRERVVYLEKKRAREAAEAAEAPTRSP